MDKRAFLLSAPALLIAQSLPAMADSAFHATKDSRITLLYLGQVSCPACRGYEAEYFGRMNRMATSFPEFKEIDYLKLNMGSGKGTVSARQLPDHLKWIATETRGGESPIKNNYGTPFFVGVVDREVWAQGPAVSGLEGDVIPALRRAVLERSGRA